MRESSSTLLHDDEGSSPEDAALVLFALIAMVEPEAPRADVRSRLMESIARHGARAA